MKRHVSLEAVHTHTHTHTHTTKYYINKKSVLENADYIVIPEN